MPVTDPTVQTLPIMHLRGLQHDGHEAVLIQYRDGEVLVCGQSWCGGDCNLPAAVLHCPIWRMEMKLYGPMTAVGPVMQAWRTVWRGSRYVIPEPSKYRIAHYRVDKPILDLKADQPTGRRDGKGDDSDHACLVTGSTQL